jgi:hypothetical protein
VRARLFVFLAALSSGCARDSFDAQCSDLEVGDLVVTEIGGPQTGMPSLAPWIELYNASGRSVDLSGVMLRFRSPSGGSETDTIVRRSLVVAAGGYVVLGLSGDVVRPAYIDYGLVDFYVSWPAVAVVDVEACGARIDRVQYPALPRTGTYSLGALDAQPPTAQANDIPANWCTDTTSAGIFPGTPQRANNACP